MLTVDKINNNVSFKSRNIKLNSKYSFGTEAETWKAYQDMNRAIYIYYPDGDISLFGLLGDKLGNLWAILTSKEPSLEIKERMIAESLLNQSQRELDLIM